ncbi:replication-relaxation family protein [Actinomadura rupiterrae]|uniref:replication-relaxation family protein n=1 Tax=Actinomadura rupiterrae TaxID=559627 RepID=UPI0020A4FFC3|nr:replication-relaxation family protein [Actinomadura rupiterrae]MCP2342004.1 hypothetical protein [Actinomadura rupiterrae]
MNPRIKIRERRVRRGTRPRLSPDLIARLSTRITDRDRAILDLVWEHRVFTTNQLAAIYFPTINKARHRLTELHRLTALEYFRPWTPIGSAPNHWVLGPAGAHVVAAGRGVPVEDLGYRRDRALGIVMSSKLGHQLGINEFFTQLRAHARNSAGRAELREWWPEGHCSDLWGDLIQPDAFGRWRELKQPLRLPAEPSEPVQDAPVEFDFFLEHDTGTETHKQLADKLHGYAELADSSKITTPVLFSLPSPRREANFRKYLGTPPVPVATAVHTSACTPQGPAGPIWLPVGLTRPRRTLIELAEVWRGYDDRRDPTLTDTV